VLLAANDSKLFLRTRNQDIEFRIVNVLACRVVLQKPSKGVVPKEAIRLGVTSRDCGRRIV
jgi:hypothetical protein